METVMDHIKLQDWLASRIPGLRGPITVQQLSGGQSNPTYRIRTSSGDYVLRRKPDGKLLPSAHAVDREHRVITALHAAGLPTPATYGYSDDLSIAGTPFFVMDFIPGRIFFDPRLPEVARPERAALFDAMNATLAQLHSIDPAAAGLGDFGRPGNYMGRQIDRWSKQYRASETQRIEAMEQLMQWLPAQLAANDDPAVSVVHGDCRMDNFVFHPTEPRVVAVLDWELSTLGSPLCDFAYNAMTWRIQPGLFRGLAGSDLTALGVPLEADYVAAYCRRTGRAGIPGLDFYIAFNLFRLAAIMQGIMQRVLEGTAVGPDAEANGKLALPIAELGWQVAQRA
jgi:aminoglycoside phosphotransferase (APT) family kinase protein